LSTKIRVSGSTPGRAAKKLHPGVFLFLFVSVKIKYSVESKEGI